MTTPQAPVDPDAEAAVLAAALTSTQAYADVTEILAPDDFGIAANVLIMRAAHTLDSQGKPVDQITLADELRRNRNLNQAGGPERLHELFTHAIDVGNTTEHAKIVSEKAKLRRLLEAARHTAAATLDPNADAEQVISDAEARIYAINARTRTNRITAMPAAVEATLAEIAAASSHDLLGVTTGLTSLDAITGGFTPGQLVLIAARPAMGKSAIATQIARAIADSTGKHVPLLSYEMSTTEITMRLLASAARHDLHRLRQGHIPPGAQQALADAAQQLTTSTLLIDDNPPETIGGIRSQMRRLASRTPIAAIVIDYLQLIAGDQRRRDENRTQEISDISRGLKRLATELNVPVIALSQLNRGLEQRPNKRPQMSDLRDSGALEQDASVIIMLYREHVYNAAADPEALELIVAKQRSGPCGTVHARFLGATTTITEATQPGSPPAGHNPF